MKSIIYSGQQVAYQCSIAESSFDDVNLQKSFFNNVNLEKSGFTNVNLGHSSFYDINLCCTKFSFVNLGGVVFSNIFSNSTNHLGQTKNNPISFVDSDLSASTFSKVNLQNAKFEDCDIEGLVINGVDIEALIKGEALVPELLQIGWRTQNETGSTNKVSKSHYMIQGSDKTLCGVDIPSSDKVAQMSADIGSGACKRCLNIKKNYTNS